MQDIEVIGGGSSGGGSVFGGRDRRLRPHNHPNHQALKCPRCDSLNTKFCYYNNYNLSQPRYFCKTCRRYWTKGGVLRNVPVGGGCRKTKRSKPKSSAASAGDVPRENELNSQSSSSESSGLTAGATVTTPISATTAVAEEGSALSNTTSNSVVAYNFPDARFFNVNLQANPTFDNQPLVNHHLADGQIFTTEIGSFTRLITSSEEMIGFGMGDIQSTSYRQAQQGNQEPEAENPGSGMVGSTAVDEFKMQDMCNEGLDWGSGGGVDQELFDLTAGVDPAAYWSQPQWTDNYQSLNYLP